MFPLLQYTSYISSNPIQDMSVCVKFLGKQLNKVLFLSSRYLYPVDKNRIDMSGMIEETTEEVTDQVSANAEAANPGATNAGPAKESEGLTRRKPKKEWT